MKKNLMKAAAAIALSLSLAAIPAAAFYSPLRAEAIVDADTGARELGVTISNKTVPSGNLPLGRPYGISGTINSQNTILQVFGGIYNAEGTKAVLFCSDSPSSTTYDLRSKFDNLLTFNTLPAGSYKYRIIVRTAKDDIEVATSYFTVGNAAPYSASSGITVTGKKVPENGLTYGRPYIIGGVLSSASPITEVYGGIYTADGNTSVIYCKDTPNSTSYDLGVKFDNTLTFDKLPPGNYSYKIIARNSGGESVVAESTFYISLIPSERLYAGLWEQTALYNACEAAGSGFKPVSSDKGTTQGGLPAWIVGVQKADGSDPTVYSYYVSDQFTTPVSAPTAKSSGKVTVSGQKVPSGSLRQGQPCTISGFISSPSSISKVYGGVYTSDGKNGVLYCEDFPYSTAYDLSRIFDNALTFNTLAPGSYTYKINIRNADGDTVVSESAFTVNGEPADTAGNNGQTAPKVSISGNSLPTGTLKKGSPFIISGNIASNQNINQVFGGVYSADGSKSILYCTDTPMTRNYDLRNVFDNALTFDTLPSGNYIYKITVRTVSDDVVVAQSSFTIS